MARTKMENIKEVLKFHSGVIGNLVNIEKSVDRYRIVTDKLNGTLQVHNGFYYIGYVTDSSDAGWIDAIGLMVLTEKTLVRMIQSHVPDRTLQYWEEKIESVNLNELEEDLVQTYNILRQIQRKG
ncbi:MAG: hypothetical protein QXO37_09095 [Candidatus Nitrosocaldaceae archaeon]